MAKKILKFETKIEMVPVNIDRILALHLRSIAKEVPTSKRKVLAILREFASNAVCVQLDSLETDESCLRIAEMLNKKFFPELTEESK